MPSAFYYDTYKALLKRAGALEAAADMATPVTNDGGPDSWVVGGDGRFAYPDRETAARNFLFDVAAGTVRKDTLDAFYSKLT